MRRAFTLIELLVVIAVVALLISLLLPALAKARESGRAVLCLANHKNCAVLIQSYADDYKGYSPALGWPYDRSPNWAVVVQNGAGLTSNLAVETRAQRSVLVCPSASAFHGRAMLRTYAINATGHAGQPGDPDTFEPAAGDPNPLSAHARIDRVRFPSQTPILVDSTSPPQGATVTPTLLCASLIDFRQQPMVDARLGKYHASNAACQASMLDSSARLFRDLTPLPQEWLAPLP